MNTRCFLSESSRYFQGEDDVACPNAQFSGKNPGPGTLVYIIALRSSDLALERWQLQTWLIQFWNPLLMETGIGYAVSRIFHPGRNSEAKYAISGKNPGPCTLV